jgi:hypothetical protein
LLMHPDKLAQRGQVATDADRERFQLMKHAYEVRTCLYRCKGLYDAGKNTPHHNNATASEFHPHRRSSLIHTRETRTMPSEPKGSSGSTNPSASIRRSSHTTLPPLPSLTD